MLCVCTTTALTRCSERLLPLAPRAGWQPGFLPLSKQASPRSRSASALPPPQGSSLLPAADCTATQGPRQEPQQETQRTSLLAPTAKTPVEKTFCLFSQLKSSEFIFEASLSKPCICLTRKIRNNLLKHERLLSLITFHTSKSIRPPFTFFCNRITDVHFFSRSPAYFLSNSSF